MSNSNRNILFFVGLLAATSMLCSETLLAQTMIYRDRFRQKVDSTEVYVQFDQITPIDDSLRFVKEYLVENGLQRAGAWLHYNPDSVGKATPVGLHQFYHQFGILWYTKHFQAGKLEELRSYYPDGKLKRIETYQEGRLLSGKCFQRDSTEMPFVPFEQMPMFPGGERALMQYLTSNIIYPKKARKNNIQGNVVLSFVVEKSGKISKIEVLRGVGGGCTEEAVRVIEQMPPWEPGKTDGVPVKVRFTLPIRFRLE